MNECFGAKWSSWQIETSNSKTSSNKRWSASMSSSLGIFRQKCVNLEIWLNDLFWGIKALRRPTHPLLSWSFQRWQWCPGKAVRQRKFPNCSLCQLWGEHQEYSTGVAILNNITLSLSQTTTISSTVVQYYNNHGTGIHIDFAQEPQQQAVFFYRRLLRAESYRKALVWQKR